MIHADLCASSSPTCNPIVDFRILLLFRRKKATTVNTETKWIGIFKKKPFSVKSKVSTSQGSETMFLSF